MTPTPYRDGKMYVCAHKCSTCVFRPGNLMSLESGRLRDLVQTNLANGSALTCHKTIYENPDEQEHAICRGFYDGFKDHSPALRLAQSWDIIEFIEPPASDADSDS